MSGLLPRPPAGDEGRTLSLLTFVQSVGYGSFAACGALFFIRSVGLSVREVGIGTALAGLAGVLGATLFSFNPSYGSGDLLKAFVIVVLGGLGSVMGTAVASLILALVEVFAILALPAYLTGAVGFVILVLVLVFRPGGLFGQRVLG